MSDSQFIFCEGCGARLTPQDRSCPKCGHPAPGILSAQSAASDLAAGKTASFPRLSQDMIEGAVPTPGVADPFVSIPDPDATGVLDPDALTQAGQGAHDPARSAGRGGRSAASRRAGFDAHADAEGFDPAKEPRKRGRLIAAVVACAVVLGGSAFVALDPLGVMPGVYESFDRAAAEAFPSRQQPEDGSPVEEGSEEGEPAPSAPELDEQTLSEDAAFTRLSAIYDRITGFQQALGPVIDGYNGYYIANDRALREQGSQLAYDLRDTIQATRDELSSLKLTEGSAYLEDVDHLQQLATWMYNRVDVLCRSWDISLGLPEGELPLDHQDEILTPLREVEMIDGKAIDVIEYESNVIAWKPQQK